MERNDIAISIVYKDNFSEYYKIDDQGLERTIREAKDESQSDFHIGEKRFIKKDIAVVATSDFSIQFF